jgi:hypothetical protein
MENGFWGELVRPDCAWDRALVCVCGAFEIWDRNVGTVFIKTFLGYLKVLFGVQEIPKLKTIPTEILFSLQ